MKSQPGIIVDKEGFVPCQKEMATHLRLRFPGPQGQLMIPVVIKQQITGKWNWNGNVDSPTLNPSILTRSGHFCPDFRPTDHCWCKYWKEHPDEKAVFHCYICHSYVTDGRVKFLGDCTHEYAGKTVELLDIKE